MVEHEAGKVKASPAEAVVQPFGSPWPGTTRFLFETVVIILLYVTTAQLGFLVAIPPGNVTILWPPSGIAVASLMLWGNRGCVGVALGASLANFLFLQGRLAVLPTLLISVGIAFGSTMQSAVIVGVVRRHFDPDRLFSNLRMLLKFALVAVVGCIIAASAGLASLGFAGLVARDAYQSVWAIWWLGDCVGILVVALPMYIFVSRILRRTFSQMLIPALIWSVGIGISAFIFIFMRRLEVERIKAELVLDAETERIAVETSIQFNMWNLNAISGLFTASDYVNRKDFRRFVHTMLDKDPNKAGVQAFEWIPRVKADKRAQFEEMARADGFNTYTFTEMDAHGAMVPAQSRPEYFPVYYVVPTQGNLLALGFDLASDKLRYEALTAARETGQPIATDTVQLVQDTGYQKAFLIFLPIFSQNKQAITDPPKRDELIGLALGVFRIVDLIEASLKRVPRGGIDIVLTNTKSSGDQEIVYSNISSIPTDRVDAKFNPQKLKAGFFHVSQIQVANRTWEMISKATPSYISERRTIQSWILPLGGLGLALLMVMYVISRQEAEHILRQKNLELVDLNNEIKIQQAQLLISEKMSSVGQLAAGVAHEINNPAGFVSGNLTTLKKYIAMLLELQDKCDALYIDVSAGTDDAKEKIQAIAAFKKKIKYDFLRLDIEELMTESIDGMGRIARIVKDLRDFSHVENPDVTELCDLREMVEKTINVAWNELKHRCTIHKDYQELPKLRLNRGEINQVILNLLVNASQAIVGKGDIYIRTFREDDQAILEIKDTGMGIPEAIQTKIFDPFFTTKPVGQGTGLGLHICQKIIAVHQGHIDLISQEGVGTTFRVFLPIRSDNDSQIASSAEREYWGWQS